MHAYGALRLVGGRHNNVGVSLQERLGTTQSNVRGVTAGKVGRNSSIHNKYKAFLSFQQYHHTAHSRANTGVV